MTKDYVGALGLVRMTFLTESTIYGDWKCKVALEDGTDMRKIMNDFQGAIKGMTGAPVSFYGYAADFALQREMNEQQLQRWINQYEENMFGPAWLVKILHR